ncbi:hypothetical protein [Laribacter hongkongensis]|uniref:Uncharacterized protein n=1 Tax=Laribacter hongkongensis TaxID=168471 RepID=A0A248LI59_9NEIS|nr:hypothetical protein [Laribacter hongkongensis]ASJ24144.1 hypothetical protein LHGZ1_1313 [Laribacter hongkongensis]MCG9060264.1 hypothetical protein [Laribacter hongkongensis]MCG9081473.1 hypothetical protein [Laribacter hongkongensis]MCG9087345.1 hypothetical protein [Laribacter hongkongensis]MCG9090234.1 hypothetical protein [Laribacter hongkongensis]
MSKSYPIKTWKTYTVAFFGAFCFLGSAYYLLILGKVMPDVIEASNATPFMEWWPKGVVTWLLCGICALIAWPLVAMAQECHSVLKERLLQKLFG